MRLRWKKIVLALLVIVAAGIVRLPFEQRYTDSMRKQNLLETPLNLSMRDELGQTFFVAVLGGFRSVVASMVELQSITAWDQGNWGIVDELYSICTRLQPREQHYWEHRSWHLAANARDHYLWDSMLSDASRHSLAQQHVEKGMAVVREGLTWLPQSWRLWDRLGHYASMPWNENPDHAAAAEYYASAAKVSGRALYWRLHVYQVAKIPGREREAWEKLLELFSSPNEMNRTPSVMIELVRLFRDKTALLGPGAKLPDELFRLVFDPTAKLTAQEQQNAAWLRARADENAGLKKKRSGRAPQIISPHFQSK